MAKREIIIDDFDGTEGAEKVTFALHGKTYSLDLNEKNAAKLEKALSEFIEKADEVAKANAPKSAKKGGSRNDLPLIRAWAEANGHGSHPRRIPGDVINAYDAAH